MLPRRCSQPACMNMAVKIVRKYRVGLAKRWLGTTDQRSMNALLLLSSTRKTSMLTTINPYVTIGTVRREESSSPRGNIVSLLLIHFQFYLYCLILQFPTELF